MIKPEWRVCSTLGYTDTGFGLELYNKIRARLPHGFNYFSDKGTVPYYLARIFNWKRHYYWGEKRFSTALEPRSWQYTRTLPLWQTGSHD